MKSSNNSILALQHSGSDSNNFIFKNNETGLKSIWIEIPDYCHLHCDYCYASTDNEPKKVDQYMSYSDYEKILKELSALGGKFVGIPGKGEPFHSKNWELTKSIIGLCHQLNLDLAIFTTGDAIFFNARDTIDADPTMDKMEYMKDKNLTLLIKCNSLKPEIQNKLVNDKHNKYTQLRDRAIDILINKYHLNESHRLGIVTSVLKDNENEIVDLYKWAKERNIIFDCDTILERGRGREFTSSGQVPQKIDLEAVFKKLKEVGAITSCQGGTYVGSTCDRVLHHLYISVEGEAFSCIGCLREDIKDKFILGNIKNQTLESLWKNEFKQKLATNHKQVITGTCWLCQNFQDEKCYSCLGRCITENGVKKNEMLIETQGCIHHKPNTINWIVKLTDYLRTILSLVKTKKTLKEEGLEYLWMPNNKNADTVVNDFSKEKHYRFPEKKHCKLSEISFPMNKCWDFINIKKNSEDTISNDISKSYLSNIFLSSFKILFDKYDPDNRIVQFCNFMLYDNFHNSYFYRSISSLPNQSIDNDIRNIIIANWYEDFKDRNFWKDYCLDLSDTFSDEFYSHYELILKKDNGDRRNKKDIFDLSDFINNESIIQKSQQFSNYVSENNEGFKSLFDKIKDIINSNVFLQLEADKTTTLRSLYEEINKQTFFSLNDDENKILLDWLKEKIQSKVKKDGRWVKLQNEYIRLLENNKASMFLNYLVYLRIVHDVFRTNYYYLIYSTNFKENSEEVADNLRDVLKPSGLMLCTSSPLDINFKNELRLFISNILNPIDEFYFTHIYGKIQANRQFQEKIEAHRHTINNFLPPLFKYIDKVPEINKFGKIGLKRIQTILYDFIERYDEKLGEMDEILNELVEYFNSGYDTEIGGYRIYSAETESDIKECKISISIKEQIDFFTICFNLLHNASKFQNYLNYKETKLKTIALSAKEIDSIYIIEITNPGLIRNKIIKLINDKILTDEKIDKTKGIKRTGGLVISKKLCIKNNWQLSCKTKNNNTIFELRIIKSK